MTNWTLPFGPDFAAHHREVCPICRGEGVDHDGATHDAYEADRPPRQESATSPQVYATKPVQIEAEGPLHIGNIDRIAKWCGGRVIVEAKASDPTDVYRGLDIPTLEGVMRGNLGDYIIRGTEGEFYPCKPEPFEKKYERVRTSPSSGRES